MSKPMPKGCVCEPKTWGGDPDEVCGQFIPSPMRNAWCDTCGHHEACHLPAESLDLDASIHDAEPKSFECECGDSTLVGTHRPSGCFVEPPKPAPVPMDISTESQFETWWQQSGWSFEYRVIAISAWYAAKEPK